MTPLQLTLLVAAIGALAGIAVIAVLLREDLSGRGEVADVPEVEDIPQAKSLDEFPAKRPCVLNAEPPHWCADTSGDDAVIAELEKQFPNITDRRIR